MKELIKMKPNWVAEHSISKTLKIKSIMVSNYDLLGTVSHFGFLKKEETKYKDCFDIGMWHVKYKELKSK